MSSKTPIVKQIAWLSLLPQIIALAIFFFVIKSSGFKEPFLLAAILYFVIAMLLRYSISFHHRRGMSYLKKKKYKEAIEMYKKSYSYFSKHPWIDKYRFITLFSSSRISYTEMALLNIAFSYAQVGDGENSKKYYDKTLKEFPDSEIAKTSLNMINSFNKTKA